MKLKTSLILCFAVIVDILVTTKLVNSADSEDFVNKGENSILEPEIFLSEKTLQRKSNYGEGKSKIDSELELELEAFKVASELSTSFVKKIPQQFKKIYTKSDGTAQGMYKNCLYGFLILIKNRKVSPILYVKTLVYRVGHSYYFELGEIKNEIEKQNARLVKLQVGEAIHLFCMKASSLYYTRDELRPLDRRIKKELTRIENEQEKKESIKQEFENSQVEEMEEIMFYLTELLESEILSIEMDEAMNRKRRSIKSIWEIETERKLDREKIKEYKNMVKLVRIPLPETRLRDRHGKIHHPESENKLRVSKRIQEESDQIKSRLDQIKRDEKIIMGGNERFVDFERRKYLEAALKRNQLLSFKKNRQIISERKNENIKNQEERLKCECDQEDDCVCRIVDLYGETLGKPVSLKLEEDLMDDHQIFKNKEKNRKAEVKYFKGLIYKDNQTESGISRRRNLHVPNSFVEIPLTGLSRLQLLTLEQLSGIDINARSSSKILPRIKEINHEKNTKISESVPVNEDSKSSTIRKSKSALYNRNYN